MKSNNTRAAKSTSRTPAAGKSTASASRSTTATRGAASKTAAPKAASRPAPARAASAARTAKAPVKAAAAPARNTKAAASRAAAKKQASHSEDLTKIMVDTLKDIYYAEKHLVKGLNKMAKAAAHEELRAAFETHRTETEQQIQQLEEAFRLLGVRAQGKRCAAMDGLLEEGSEHIEEYDKGAARDAALIVGAQKIEHYEMAAYGSLRTFAQLLGNNDVQDIFQTILDQEGATDEKLTALAQTVNQAALSDERDAAVPQETALQNA